MFCDQDPCKIQLIGDCISRRSSWEKSYYFFLVILLVLKSLSAQTFDIQGIITTKDLTPVRYVSVNFINQNDTTQRFSTITDTAGHFQIQLTTAIGHLDFNLPSTIELAQNYPNPFSGNTLIRYQIAKSADVSLKIYNLLGKEVRELKDARHIAGAYGLIWDGRDNNGKMVATGIYFYQLRADNEIKVKKMVYGFSGANGYIMNNLNPMNFATISNHQNKLKKENKISVTTGAFTVQVENTDSTKPRIVPEKFPDIVIHQDTTINFQVQKAEQWHFLGLGDETVTAIAVDPIDPKIIYAGTASDFSAGINGKLFKSTDGGVTWDTLLVGGSYKSILIDPSNPNIIYAMPFSIIKSEDAGKTWRPIVDGIKLDWETRVQSLAINPKNPRVLYAGTAGFYTGNLYKSTDGGWNWNKTQSDSLLAGVTSIAIDPVDTNIVYAGTAWRGILWKSTDAGKKWFRTGLRETGLPIHDILINPDQPSTVYAGLRGIFKTEDGGISWENISYGLPKAIFDVVKIQQSNFSRLFLVATFEDDGGIYEYSAEQNRWIRIGIDALHVSYYYSDLKSYANPDRLYFGCKGIYVGYLKY